MLSQRIISAVLGIIYIVCMLFFGGWFFKISVLLMALILIHEFYQAFKAKGYRPFIWLGFIFLIILFYFYLTSYKYSIVVLMSVFVIVALSLPIFAKKIGPMDVLITVFGAIYPGMMIFFFIPLAFEAGAYGMNLLILTFLITWATDTFAYFVGKSLGKNQLCPDISPNKTVEGGIGGLLGSIIIGIVFGIVANKLLTWETPLYHFGLMGLLGGVLSQIGDLSASYIKRFCKIKDFGKILPGHGGLLDRFDSLLFVLPAIYIYYMIFLIQ